MRRAKTPGRRRAEPRHGDRSEPALAPPPDPLHPAYVIAVAIAAACILFSVSFALYDTDMWQHLAVGRSIWLLHALPTRQLWTWPNYGAPDVNASWGFRLLIWPLWHAAGVTGLFAWRWLTTLAAFALLWRAARRMGARGLTPLVVAVLCSLIYRHRSQIRPETLTAVLFAAEIWILESWREAWHERPADWRRDPRLWLVPIAWAWANVHISYWLGLAVQGIYLIASGHQRGREPEARAGSALEGRRHALAILAASAAISFVNPWGWKALWQPFDYFLHWRHEPIFQTIGELQPVDWSYHARDGLAILIAGWIVLLIWRARAFRLDRVEALMFALFAALALPTQRFVGIFALAAFPFVARDLDAWVRSRAWAKRAAARESGGSAAPARESGSSAPPARESGKDRPPARSRSVWVRGALAALACVAIGIPEWTRPSALIGVRLEQRVVPVRACDFMAAHGVHGRGFNQFAAGGYLLYRFWPDRSRLPFMDIHQSGSREDRYLYALAQQDSAAWRALDRKYRFDYALIYTHQYANDRLIEFLDADRSRWALVFSDDAAALFVRRDGPLASLAHSFEYRRLPAGIAPIALLEACRSDSLARGELEAELTRSIRESPWNTRASLLLAPLLMIDRRLVDAHRLLDQAIHDNPLAFEAHASRGEVELEQGLAAEARADFEREIRLAGESAYLDQAMARCFERLGDLEAVRAWQRRAGRVPAVRSR